jgi:outer membrane protein assembly factor BamB
MRNLGLFIVIAMAGRVSADFGTPYVAWTYDPAYYAFSSPAFADIDGVSGAEIIFSTNYDVGHVYCLNSDGSFRWSRSLGSASVQPWVFSSPAIADLDSDGVPEILIAGRSGTALHCFSPTGNVKWTFPIDASNSPVVANVDTIGDAEILIPCATALYCLNSDGSVKWSYASTTGHAVAVSDLDRVGYPEVILTAGNNGILCLNGNDGSLVWSCPCTVSTSPSIADVDLDCYPEIIVANRRLFCIESDGTLKWSYEPPDAPLLRGGVGIADLDFLPGDRPEMVVYSYEKQALYCMRENVTATGGELVWSKQADDNIWGPSGPSLCICDIDGDNDRDVIWCGNYLAILNGPDGNHPDNSGNPFYRNTSFQSYTGSEHPTVGDVDGDSIAEILAIHNRGGIAMLKCDSWAKHRGLWSDYQYHICNIKDDLTVPKREPAHWRTHNTWLTQTPPEDSFPCFCHEIKDETHKAMLSSSPNPFTERTVISYRLPTATQGVVLRDPHSHPGLSTMDCGLPTIAIYDITGRLVRSFPFNHSPITTHQTTWDGTTNSGEPVQSGIYFCVLRTSSSVRKIQMVVLSENN